MALTAPSNDKLDESERPLATDDGGSGAAVATQSLDGEAHSSRTSSQAHTRISGYWAAIVTSLVVLVILIVFILENGQRAKVTFFGAHGHLPQGVALLLAAVIGGIVVAVAGIARILQLRRRSHRPSAGHRRRGATSLSDAVQ